MEEANSLASIIEHQPLIFEKALPNLAKIGKMKIVVGDKDD